ncbi:creatininase family protein [archaeon]|nr:creatininase family protein [archaeon]
MTDIKNKFDPDLRKSIIKRRQVAVIPVGSIEQHGAHLPVSTDSDIVTEIAKRVAEKNRYLLLPTLNYGVSFEHAPFFNLSLRQSTLRTVLADLCSSLLANNIKTVFVINGHHGNLNAIKNLDVRLRKASKNKLSIFSMSYWHFMQREFDHAGFVETSLMLAISKDVRMRSAKKGLTTDGMTRKEIAKIGKLANKSFPKATGNGIWGDPRKATKKDGRLILDEIVGNLEKECQTCLTRRSS